MIVQGSGQARSPSAAIIGLGYRLAHRQESGSRDFINNAMIMSFSPGANIFNLLKVGYSNKSKRFRLPLIHFTLLMFINLTLKSYKTIKSY